MRFTLNWTFIIFLAGVGLALLSSYYLVVGVYRAIAWQSTTGTITDVVLKETDDEWTFYEKATFADPTGTTIEVIASTGVAEQEDARTGEVTILFDPEDPSHAIIFQLRDYLIVLFLPFAALLILLGWPFEKIRLANPFE